MGDVQERGFGKPVDKSEGGRCSHGAGGIAASGLEHGRLGRPDRLLEDRFPGPCDAVADGLQTSADDDLRSLAPGRMPAHAVRDDHRQPIPLTPPSDPSVLVLLAHGAADGDHMDLAEGVGRGGVHLRFHGRQPSRSMKQEICPGRSSESIPWPLVRVL
jgi:hypothetical protein